MQSKGWRKSQTKANPLYALHSSLSKRVEDKEESEGDQSYVSFLKTKGILHAVIEKTKLLVADRIKVKKA